MTTIASCGHTLGPDEEGHALTLRAWSRDWNRCLRHGLLCDLCAARAQALGCVLATDEQQRAWCAGEGSDNQPCW